MLYALCVSSAEIAASAEGERRTVGWAAFVVEELPGSVLQWEGEPR